MRRSPGTATFLERLYCMLQLFFKVTIYMYMYMYVNPSCFLTLSLPEYLMEFFTVTLTFKSVDKIL